MSFLKNKPVEQTSQYMCRVCLNYSENPNSIYDVRPTTPNSDIKIVDEIYFCTNLEIEENSRCCLICEDCLVKLTISVEFKQQCHSAQRSLEELLIENENFDQEKVNEDYAESYDEEEEEEIIPTIDISDQKIKKVKKQNKKIYKEDVDIEQFEIAANNKVVATNGRQGTACPICSKIIYTNTGFDLHMRIHRDERNFECDVCFKKFRQKGAMLRHMDIHSDAKRYKCEVCDRGFNDQTSLKAHMYSHSNAQNHTCNICDKSFKYPSSYAYHMQVHSNDRKHQCDQCDAKFIRPYKLAEHKRIHSGEKPFECATCFKNFRTKKLLVSHSRVHNTATMQIVDDLNSTMDVVN